MHRLIMRAKKGQILDHINGDRFDNRKENLRFCTNSQNLANRSKTSLNKSGYKGVTFIPGRLRPWRAVITYKGKYTNLGYFETKEQAALAYNKAAVKYFGEFARYNQI